MSVSVSLLFLCVSPSHYFSFCYQVLTTRHFFFFFCRRISKKWREISSAAPFASLSMSFYLSTALSAVPLSRPPQLHRTSSLLPPLIPQSHTHTFALVRVGPSLSSLWQTVIRPPLTCSPPSSPFTASSAVPLTSQRSPPFSSSFQFPLLKWDVVYRGECVHSLSPAPVQVLGRGNGSVMKQSTAVQTHTPQVYRSSFELFWQRGKSSFVSLSYLTAREAWIGIWVVLLEWRKVKRGKKFLIISIWQRGPVTQQHSPSASARWGSVIRGSRGTLGWNKVELKHSDHSPVSPCSHQSREDS